MITITDGELLQHIHQVWQIDKKYVEEIENGFNWWPGHHKVTVRCAPKDDASDPDCWRLTVCTEFVKGINFENAKMAALIASMGSFSPSYGVRPQTAGWLPAFFARIVIMQPIDAQRTADPYAEMLRGNANKSGSRFDSGSTEIDDILNVAQGIFAPMGEEPSKWIGSTEFSDIAERYGRSDLSFGTGGPDGLTLETPFGKSSSLIRLHHDIKHPALGSGLLGTIRLPVLESLEASTNTCMWLNFFCSRHWTDAPVHGTWHPQEIRKDEYASSYGAFVPNALYADGVATNVALWNLGLARWARMKVWPDLQDYNIYDIVNARFDQFNAVNQKT